MGGAYAPRESVLRFLAMLYMMKIYNIIYFDWVLLCHSNFFPHFYPELKGIVGPHQFGYNKKAHAAQIDLRFGSGRGAALTRHRRVIHSRSRSIPITAE